jgi:hypothetical protein
VHGGRCERRLRTKRQASGRFVHSSRFGPDHRGRRLGGHHPSPPRTSPTPAAARGSPVACRASVRAPPRCGEAIVLFGLVRSPSVPGFVGHRWPTSDPLTSAPPPQKRSAGAAPGSADGLRVEKRNRSERLSTRTRRPAPLTASGSRNAIDTDVYRPAPVIGPSGAAAGQKRNRRRRLSTRRPSTARSGTVDWSLGSRGAGEGVARRQGCWRNRARMEPGPTPPSPRDRFTAKAQCRRRLQVRARL